MFRHEKELFHPVAVFGTTKAARMYFSLSEPSPENSRFTEVAGNPPSFS